MATLKFYKSANLPSSAEEGSVGFDTSSKSIKLKTGSSWENYSPASGAYATLENGKVPASQLPSYVDDVLEGTLSTFPSTGETGKIYVDTSTNLTYRWSGSKYVEISPSIGIGTTTGTAYDGGAGSTLANNLSSHTSNTTVHITAAERTKWDNAANTSHKLYKASELSDYTSDDGGTTPAGVKKAFSLITAANATNAASATKATTVSGIYTSSGGQQPPSYVSGGTVRFNMMNAFQGVSTFNEGYADVMMMDCYTGSDVPYVTALAIQKTNSPRAWIATGAKGDTTKWLNRAEIITSDNISSQTVSKASTADSVAWANVSNKPTIPTVNNATITISQSGKSNQTFTLNQSGNTTISLNDTVTTIPEYVIKTRATSTSATVALALGKTTEVTLSQATTFTLPSAPTTDLGKLREVVLKIKVGSTVYATTWPSGLAWPDGMQPSLEASTYYEFNFSYNIDCWCVAYQAFKVV